LAYQLGIDLGTTYTAAATYDPDSGRGPEVVNLGDRGPTVPSVLCLQPGGEFLAGDAAERHAVTDPQRIARQFKRRLGDPTPLVVGDASLPAEVLMARLLRWVIDTVVRVRGGERPSSIVLTHPANWGPFKRDLLDKAAELAGIGRTILLAEPQAAAISYSSQARVEQGAVIAVYDLGGGTFDAAVLRKEPDGGFTMLGTPEGIEHLGGIDVDAAVFAHVTSALGDAYEELDPDDPQALAAVSRLRIECTQAKEALSLDTEISVPVLLPTIQTEVRVTRAELEEMIRPPLADTVTALERAVRSANLAPSDIDHVLLVGGSSRIPLVAELVSARLGRPVAVDAHPKHAIALGAAIVAARAAGALRPSGPGAPGAPVAPAAPGSPPAVTAPGVPLPPPPAATRPAAPMAPPAAAAAAGRGPGPGAGASTAASNTVPAPAAARPAPPGPAGRGQPPRPGSASTSAVPPYGASTSPGGPPSPGPASPYGAAPPPAGPPPAGPGPSSPPPGAHPGPPPAPPGAYAGPPAHGGPPPPGGPASRAGGHPGVDPTFEAARSEPPPPSLGYRAAEMPPAPGKPADLPPGYLTDDLKAAKRKRERRKRRVMISLGVLLVIVAVLATLVIQELQSQPDTIAGVDVGECYTGEPADLSVVDCDEPHHGELFFRAPPGDAAADYPGTDALRELVGQACLAELPNYYGAGADVAVAAGIEVQPVVPSEDEWDDGTQDGFCVAVPAEGGTAGGSIKGQGAA
jgi:Hsp70 protein/Septum formation